MKASKCTCTIPSQVFKPIAHSTISPRVLMQGNCNYPNTYLDYYRNNK